jgi:hypothetical protein
MIYHKSNDNFKSHVIIEKTQEELVELSDSPSPEHSQL